MEQESQGEYLKRRLAEGKEILEILKKDKEGFDTSMKLADIDVETVAIALKHEDSEATLQALERLHADIHEALRLAPAFTHSETETMLKDMFEKISNMRIDCWNWYKRQKPIKIKSTLGPDSLGRGLFIKFGIDD